MAHLLGQTNILQTKARASGRYSEPQGCCAALHVLGPQHQAEPGRPVSLSTPWARQNHLCLQEARNLVWKDLKRIPYSL